MDKAAEEAVKKAEEELEIAQRKAKEAKEHLRTLRTAVGQQPQTGEASEHSASPPTSQKQTEKRTSPTGKRVVDLSEGSSRESSEEESDNRKPNPSPMAAALRAPATTTKKMDKETSKAVQAKVQALLGSQLSADNVAGLISLWKQLTRFVELGYPEDKLLTEVMLLPDATRVSLAAEPAPHDLQEWANNLTSKYLSAARGADLRRRFQAQLVRKDTERAAEYVARIMENANALLLIGAVDMSTMLSDIYSASALGELYCQRNFAIVMPIMDAIARHRITSIEQLLGALQAVQFEQVKKTPAAPALNAGTDPRKGKKKVCS